MNLKKALPAFFPDATRAVLKTLDSKDISDTKTPGILVNTFHLYNSPGKEVVKKHNGIKNFMNWQGLTISDSGGFQIMSLIKKRKIGKITDEGIKIKNKIVSPEDSIKFQFDLGTDMVIVLDDFTPPGVSQKVAIDTVKRTLNWAKRSKAQFDKEVKERNTKNKPLLLGVVQGGDFPDIREYCTKELVKIGFDGLGYGGWPIKKDGTFDYETAKIIAKNSPKDYILYGLGIGKPEDIVGMYNLGFTLFDCVLPTRDGRHKRLYVYNAKTIADIDLSKKDFYSFYQAGKQKDLGNTSPISTACDCLLCSNYRKGYLTHLFMINDTTAMRLATIHNLRFYSLLMEKLKTTCTKQNHTQSAQ